MKNKILWLCYEDLNPEIDFIFSGIRDKPEYYKMVEKNGYLLIKDLLKNPIGIYLEVY